MDILFYIGYVCHILFTFLKTRLLRTETFALGWLLSSLYRALLLSSLAHKRRYEHPCLAVAWLDVATKTDLGFFVFVGFGCILRIDLVVSWPWSDLSLCFEESGNSGAKILIFALIYTPFEESGRGAMIFRQH